jgi:hypothetical protein
MAANILQLLAQNNALGGFVKQYLEPSNTTDGVAPANTSPMTATDAEPTKTPGRTLRKRETHVTRYY